MNKAANKTIVWPKEFIEKIKKFYPEDKEVIKSLKNGSEYVERLLDSSMFFNMSPEEIVEAFEKGKENKIYEEAKKCIEAGWLRIEAWKIHISNCLKE